MARSEKGDLREIRNYAGQVQRIAGALSDDEDFARRVIEAVHTGRSAELERVFSELDIPSDVRITTIDASEPGDAVPKARAKAATKTRTITVTIGIGPFSISVTVKKESK